MGRSSVVLMLAALCIAGNSFSQFPEDALEAEREPPPKTLKLVDAIGVLYGKDTSSLRPAYHTILNHSTLSPRERLDLMLVPFKEPSRIDSLKKRDFKLYLSIYKDVETLIRSNQLSAPAEIAGIELAASRIDVKEAAKLLKERASAYALQKAVARVVREPLQDKDKVARIIPCFTEKRILDLPDMKRVLPDIYLDAMYHLEKPEVLLSKIKSSPLYASLRMDAKNRQAYYLRHYLEALTTLDRFDKSLLGDFCMTYSSKVSPRKRDLLSFRIFLPLIVKAGDDRLMRELLEYSVSWPKEFRTKHAPVALARHRTNPLVAGFLTELITKENSATAFAVLMGYRSIEIPQFHPEFSVNWSRLSLGDYGKTPEHHYGDLIGVLDKFRRKIRPLVKKDQSIESLKSKYAAIGGGLGALSSSANSFWDTAFSERFKTGKIVFVRSDEMRLLGLIDDLRSAYRRSNGFGAYMSSDGVALHEAKVFQDRGKQVNAFITSLIGNDSDEVLGMLDIPFYTAKPRRPSFFETAAQINFGFIQPVTRLLSKIREPFIGKAVWRELSPAEKETMNADALATVPVKSKVDKTSLVLEVYVRTHGKRHWISGVEMKESQK